jgi:hypothetical protein
MIGEELCWIGELEMLRGLRFEYSVDIKLLSSQVSERLK